MPAPVDIRSTDTFYLSMRTVWKEIHDDHDSTIEVAEALRKALRALSAAPWPADLPIVKTSSVLNEYTYDFHPRYRLAFRWQGVRRNKKVIEVILHLMEVTRPVE